MRMNDPCNLNVPAGATPMTIADAILRECDTETLAEVLYYIDCYMKFHDNTIKVIDLKSAESEPEVRKYEACKGCRYNDEKVHAECVFCNIVDRK